MLVRRPKCVQHVTRAVMDGNIEEKEGFRSPNTDLYTLSKEALFIAAQHVEQVGSKALKSTM